MQQEKNIVQNILAIPAETQTVEFKRLGEHDDRLVGKVLETVVSMANTDGGIIIFGVEDPEKTKLKGLDRVYGIEEGQDVFDAIGREISRVVPPLLDIWPTTIINVKEINKRIALMTIPKAPDSFRSIHNHVYVRGEKGNRLLTPHEVVSFAYARGFKKADRELANVSVQLLNTIYFEQWKEARRIKGSIETILEKTGIARRNDEGVLLPTLAGVLLFAEYPSDVMETKCAVRVLQYTGKAEHIGETPNLIGVPKTIQGSLIKQITDAHDYVLTLMRTGIRIPSGFTTEYQIPERAIKEAITNAIIHRDYHIKRDIEIKVYEDRIEIESPGLFPYNITRMNIGKVRAEGYRNDCIVKHLREFSLPPNLDQNEGVRAMRHAMAARNLYPPIFFTYPFLQDAVRVVLLNEYTATEWEKINHFLKETKYITNEQARHITGVVQRDKMAKMLKKWVNDGLLIQMIPPSRYVKETKYKLPDAMDVK